MARREFMSAGPFFTGEKDVVFAVPLDDEEKRWLRKPGKLHFIVGTLAKVDGLSVTVSPKSDRVTDSFCCFQEIEVEQGKTVCKITKWVFQDGIAMKAEWFPYPIDETSSN